MPGRSRWNIFRLPLTTRMFMPGALKRLLYQSDNSAWCTCKVCERAAPSGLGSSSRKMFHLPLRSKRLLSVKKLREGAYLRGSVGMSISGALTFCVKKNFCYEILTNPVRRTQMSFRFRVRAIALGLKSAVQKRHRSTEGRLGVFGCLVLG